MKSILEHPTCRLYCGDSTDLGALLPPNSIDAIVTDPPAGIGFMGKAWDSNKGGRDKWIKWLADTLGPAFTALKPGGHALVWALPRTSHWTAMALELAGFEIRDRVSHLFGTGFPKSLNVGNGIGTALKPACEDWWLARKPLVGTVAENVLAFGTGGINVDGCRIDGKPRTTHARGNVRTMGSTEHVGAWGVKAGELGAGPDGRWPAHVTLDEEVAAMLGEPARFFYVAKGSRREKDAGLEHLPPKSAGEATGRTDDTAGLNSPRAGAGRTGGARNTHPTVKSIALMRWLCRLITPAGGTILDPFAGSGSTGVAALAEGFAFIGCEQSPEYAEIAAARLSYALKTVTMTEMEPAAP